MLRSAGTRRARNICFLKACQPSQCAALMCRRCAEVYDVDGRLHAEPLLRAAREAGFNPDGAELIISGLCERCARREPS
jgi:Fe2+ or Zn2+ uptake regulation protein